MNTLSHNNKPSLTQQTPLKLNNLYLTDGLNQSSNLFSTPKIPVGLKYGSTYCNEGGSKPTNNTNESSANSFNLTLFSNKKMAIGFGSDLKFKSPSKLLTLKISESPWISNEKRNPYFGQFFEKSPEEDTYCYKLTFAEVNHHQEVNSNHLHRGPLYPGRRLSADFELKGLGPSMTLSQRSHHQNQPHCQDSDSDRNSIKKRRRKSSKQIKILKQYFQKSQNWTKDQITKIANQTGLSESQVYKWCWDQKKKCDEDLSESNTHNKTATLASLNLLGKRLPFSQVNDSRMTIKNWGTLKLQKI